MLAGHPKRLIIDGIDLNFMDSGEEPCKGTTNFAQLGPPWTINFYQMMKKTRHFSQTSP
jgi:hypothetical protein